MPTVLTTPAPTPVVPTTDRRPVAERFLIGFVAFQAISAIGGGTAFLIAPDGGDWFPSEWLEAIPFDTFLWPGIILGVGLGLSALLVTIGLWRRPDVPAFRFIERWTGHHWSLAGAIGLGLGLTSWIVVEVMLIGVAWLQVVYFAVGVLIVATALLPSVRRSLVLLSA